MYKMADAPRRVVGSLLFLLAVLAHIATVPVPLGPHGAYLLQNDPPNTTYVYDDVPAIEQNAWVVDPYTDWRELLQRAISGAASSHSPHHIRVIAR